MKDPEKSGGTESIGEDVEDIMTEAGKNTAKLEVLLEFFLQMIKIAEPFTDKVTGKISAIKNRLPIEQLPLSLRKKIDSIDRAFAETMSYTEWVSIFEKSIIKIKEKLSRVSNDFSEKLK